MNIVLDVDDEVSPYLDRIQSKFTGKAIAKVMAEGVLNVIQKHLSALDQKPNKNHWPKTHFYGKAADKTHVVQKGGVTFVAISQQGFRQRYYGGPIKPVNVKALTIPLIAAAYGKSARRFDLDFVPNAKGNRIGFLVRKTGSGKTAKSEAMYVLVKSVMQEGDPKVIPSDETMASAAVGAVKDLFAAI
jgi:hypothetical protein